MAPPIRFRTLKKSELSSALIPDKTPLKPVLFSESIGRPSSLVQKIASLSWSASGSLIATATSSNIRIWSPDRPNVKSSTELRNAHAKGGAAYGASGVSGDGIEKVAFCPTVEGVLASTGNDGLVRLWDVRVPGGAAGAGGKGSPLGDCKMGKEGTLLTWHPNGQEMLCGRKDSRIYSIDVRRMVSADSTPTYSLEATERIHKSDKTEYNEMSFSNSGREVFATTSHQGVQILDYPSMDLLHTLSGHAAETYCVQHSPVGSHVAVGGAESTISLWDTGTWFCTHTLSSTQQLVPIRSLSFSFDGMYVVAGSGDTAGNAKGEGSSGMHIYHVDMGDIVHTVDTVNCPTHVAWHPTRYWIAFAGDPGGLKVLGSGSTL